MPSVRNAALPAGCAALHALAGAEPQLLHVGHDEDAVLLCQLQAVVGQPVVHVLIAHQLGSHGGPIQLQRLPDALFRGYGKDDG